MGLRDMADGAPRLFGKKRSLADDAEDTDPRYSTRKQPEKPHFGGKPKKQPRIAFTGEEYGFGYQATERFLKEARDRGTVADGGVDGVSGRARRTHDDASKNSRFDYHADVPQPLRTKEQALMAVKSQTADFALVPFYSPYAGYDFETLRSMSSLFTVLGVEQVEATDRSLSRRCMNRNSTISSNHLIPAQAFRPCNDACGNPGARRTQTAAIHRAVSNRRCRGLVFPLIWQTRN